MNSLVGVNNTAPSYNVDISGTLRTSLTSYVTNISELISTATIVTNAVTCNYKLGSIFYIGTPTANFTVNITNLPSITESTRSYIISVLYVSDSNTPRYGTGTSVSTTATIGTSVTPNFSNTPITTTVTGRLMAQQFIVLYINSTLYVISNVSAYVN